MGLDITAYRKLTPKPEVDYYDKDTDPYFYAHFDQDTIDCVQKFWPGHCDGLKAGVFSFAEQHEFRAGSYSGYNYWRDWLAGISGWGDAEQCWNSDKTEGPFYELINFSDCEGVIGPKVAAKLARDFAEFETQAERMVAHLDFLEQSECTYYLEQYRHWRKAFELAADCGAVGFY